jgi:hypothetical protein
MYEFSFEFNPVRTVNNAVKDSIGTSLMEFPFNGRHTDLSKRLAL